MNNTRSSMRVSQNLSSKFKKQDSKQLRLSTFNKDSLQGLDNI